MLLDSPDEVWDQLHEATSKNGLDKILELQGFYIKSGQMCAANIGNAFPKIWQDTMSVLQDECPAEPFEVVKGIVEGEYGKKLDQVFDSFEEVPIGAASIGQVHRATLKDGTRVVVKVMYPGVEDVFRGDVRTIKMFCEVCFDCASLELQKQFMTEFDYELEAKQLAKVRKNMMAANIAGDSSRLCAIPKPYLDLCTKRVLVMEELKGNKLVVELKKDMERQMERMNNSLGDDAAEKFSKDKSSLPMNHAKLILVDGCFNGDPHPGNILLLGVDEGKPQLGLIDYGQVKQISKEERILFCKIIVALANKDKEMVVQCMKEAGYKTQRMDPDIMYRFATLAYDEDNHELTEGQHIQLYMEHLHHKDPVEHLPQQYIMASRVSILLRGLGHAVHQSRSVAEAWKPIAEKVLKEEGQL
ncbi:predicted protein [Thalassiosira pseudonana CCMP1335]|uniref:ABC1 atypical kinase-like domain-containing protein n=1 Tax=Thalassiosira pseudonana TaxID=35128 RepID=B8BSR3_THAPS|nr:predicted protein [Thalassiosira pseudonana CCMP1335]EED95588.1 predicted protein [Thalassiosira pseudonana CCMP1335]